MVRGASKSVAKPIDKAGKGSAGSRKSGLLMRLRKDQRGSTLAVMAMSLIPIAGVIGSGLDMGRAYMTKAKLQNACDAAALAARREMSGSSFSAAAEAEGERFFNFNFPEGTMETTPVALDIRASAADASVVEITAETVMPTTVMKLFGKDSIELEVNCDADKDYVNNDVMLVLDVTGSMNCAVGSGATGCTNTQGNGATSRISALRGAAGALYDALDHDSPDVITRYGFMPYSATTNVGRDLPLNLAANPAIYHTSTSSTSTVSSTKTNTWLTGTWRGTVSDTAVTNTTWGFWGCVEERSSYPDRTAAQITIRTAVAREDIDTISTTDQKQKWAPYDHSTTTATPYEVCPAPAVKLAPYASRQAFDTKLNAATRFRGGSTHHDVGMIWGTRYLSPTGIFSADNPTTRNQIPVQKHIVFLSDGAMQVNSYFYSAIGLPMRRVRTTGSGTNDQKASARFLSTCNRAREMEMTVWVIVLDVDFADANLRNCASGNDHYFEASTPEQLENAFDLIGKGIGRLRLTQ